MPLTPKCSFRIIGLSELQLAEISAKHLCDTPYRTGSHHKDKTKKVLRLILDEKVSSDFIMGLLKDSPGGVYYDFFISVSSEEQTGLVNVPKFVLDLYKNVGGEICFSYTCI